MRQAAAKQEELRLVEILRRGFSEFPDGELIADENQERPDVILKAGAGKIGIEVTRILNQDLRRAESECDQMIGAARKLYEQRHLPHLHVCVHITNEKVFARHNRQKFASALAEIVAASTADEDEVQEIENSWSDPEAFPYEIASVLILRNRALTQNHWHAGKAGFILDNFADQLQAVIAQKEDRIPGYDAQCEELWLLIVAENNNPSAAFDPCPTTLNHPYRSSFNKVFFLDLFKGNAHQLITTPK